MNHWLLHFDGEDASIEHLEYSLERARDCGLNDRE
jgi:hypothetical protein